MPILPLEITEEIINLLAQDDPSFSSIRSCAQVCHDFRHVSRKQIFGSISLNDWHGQPSLPFRRITKTTIPKLRKLLDTSPEIADYIRNLVYSISLDDITNDSVVRTLSKITRLEYLFVQRCDARTLQWHKTPLRPVLLHLLHLSTLLRFRIRVVDNFITSDLAPCVNLEEFKLEFIKASGANEAIASETSLRLRNISADAGSTSAIMAICTAHRADGKPFIDFDCLNNLSIVIYGWSEAVPNLFRRCEQLINVEVDVGAWPSVEGGGLARMLYPSRQTLKHIHIRTRFNEFEFKEIGSPDILYGLCNDLEEMEHRNVVETITIGVEVHIYSDYRRMDEWGRLDTTLAQSGWPKLQRVSLEIIFWTFERPDDELESALREMPEAHFPKLTSSKSLSFEFSVREMFPL